ncbi:signal peptide containing protein [Theileria equi strain WA]|uniref:Signal peptide containing protein n=1 Tax=Theileria equi strain WA TaxID=1537102 RepID=L1LGV5_THEEQ|nr:signal peptide containing protein [Theileria equi strain WA]EKX74353.1 signal peptide containing protein [Theileria equi strain WA]|eukprot:XP_004833805.1 signal peptide containing protein [Theileria equi strain WA]
MFLFIILTISRIVYCNKIGIFLTDSPSTASKLCHFKHRVGGDIVWEEVLIGDLKLNDGGRILYDLAILAIDHLTGDKV